MLKAVARRVLRNEIEELEQDAFDEGFNSGHARASEQEELRVAYARSGAYVDGLREGQKGNALSYAQGYEQAYADLSDDYKSPYNEGYDAGFEAGKSEGASEGFAAGYEEGRIVPEDEAASLEDCCESVQSDGFDKYDSGYGSGYHAGYEAAKQNDKQLIDCAYKIGVNDVALKLHKSLSPDTFALLTRVLERSQRG